MAIMVEIINFTCDKCCIGCEHDKKKCIARKLRSRAVNRAKYKAKKDYEKKKKEESK
jgi:hypothetical protein